MRFTRNIINNIFAIFSLFSSTVQAASNTVLAIDIEQELLKSFNKYISSVTRLKFCRKKRDDANAELEIVEKIVSQDLNLQKVVKDAEKELEAAKQVAHAAEFEASRANNKIIKLRKEFINLDRAYATCISTNSSASEQAEEKRTVAKKDLIIKNEKNKVAKKAVEDAVKKLCVTKRVIFQYLNPEKAVNDVKVAVNDVIQKFSKLLNTEGLLKAAEKRVEAVKRYASLLETAKKDANNINKMYYIAEMELNEAITTAITAQEESYKVNFDISEQPSREKIVNILKKAAEDAQKAVKNSQKEVVTAKNVWNDARNFCGSRKVLEIVQAKVNAAKKERNAAKVNKEAASFMLNLKAKLQCHQLMVNTAKKNVQDAERKYAVAEKTFRALQDDASQETTEQKDLDSAKEILENFEYFAEVSACDARKKRVDLCTPVQKAVDDADRRLLITKIKLAITNRILNDERNRARNQGHFSS